MHQAVILAFLSVFAFPGLLHVSVFLLTLLFSLLV